MKLYIKILVFAAIVAGINACNKETVEVPIGEDMEMTVEATFPNQLRHKAFASFL